MGLFEGDGGRTEKATPKRRSEAREKGQGGKSQRLTGAVVFLGVFYLLGLYGTTIVRQLAEMLHRFLGQAPPRELTEEVVHQLLLRCATDVAGAVFVVSASAIALGVGANVVQGGLSLSAGRLALHFENLNPVAGFKRLMPGTTIVELLKSVLIIAAITYAAYSVIYAAIGQFPRFVLLAPVDMSARVGTLIYDFSMKCAVFLVLIGAADYYWNVRKFEKSIRMTKESIKDEAKNSEGNPEVKSKIRRKQRQMALRNMMAGVPKADVVITNPTHYAVALRYRPETMTAPTVIAKGKGFVALKIREIALENKIPMVENPPLAQSLFKAVNIGEQVPAGLFKAVAEVLAYVYRLKSMRL